MGYLLFVQRLQKGKKVLLRRTGLFICKILENVSKNILVLPPTHSYNLKGTKKSIVHHLTIIHQNWKF